MQWLSGYHCGVKRVLLVVSHVNFERQLEHTLILTTQNHYGPIHLWPS